MSAPRVSRPSELPALRWDVFCRVVDNFGDIGVCWRLARGLARRGHAVRLWTDDATALRWMAPAGEPGVAVGTWTGATRFPPPGDVVVEAFGCDPPPEFIGAMAAAAPTPAWINLEYLSAEDYVERSHGLASPRMAEPGRGLRKWFFYPGFAPGTGGLLREPGLEAAQAAFDRGAWLAAQGLALRPGERLVSLFCYPGAPVGRLLDSLAGDGRPTLLATAPGAATAAVHDALPPGGALRQHAMPWLTQDDFDRQLWASELNFVRGEDSWVRAHWAGRPFVWQAYPQDDGAHGAKVEAFLARALDGAGAAAAAHLRTWTRAWNALADDPVDLPPWTPSALAATGEALRGWRAALLGQADLVTSLLAFVGRKR